MLEAMKKAVAIMKAGDYEGAGYDHGGGDDDEFYDDLEQDQTRREIESLELNSPPAHRVGDDDEIDDDLEQARIERERKALELKSPPAQATPPPEKSPNIWNIFRPKKDRKQTIFKSLKKNLKSMYKKPMNTYHHYLNAYAVYAREKKSDAVNADIRKEGDASWKIWKKKSKSSKVQELQEYENQVKYLLNFEEQAVKSLGSYVVNSRKRCAPIEEEEEEEDIVLPKAVPTIKVPTVNAPSSVCDTITVFAPLFF